jgi:predicted amidohydrolase
MNWFCDCYATSIASASDKIISILAIFLRIRIIMTEYSRFKLAAVQAAPVYFNRDASTGKACRLILEAGATGANLAAFGETWLPGYPFFVWGSRSSKVAAEYLANAVRIPSTTTDQLCEAARQANIDVVIGIAELDAQTRGTVYCTLLFISNEGVILGRHRKIKPTHRERTAWGEGDGSSLIVYERPYGKISGLNCWEHRMVLPGYALMAQGAQIHIAAWPGMSWSGHELLSRAFAFQAAAYVIDVGAILSAEHVTGMAKEAINGSHAESYAEQIDPGYVGQSCIIDPRGNVIAGPAEGEKLLFAEGSTQKIFEVKSFCDVGGHYSRPDILQLHVNRSSYRRVVEMNGLKYVDYEAEVIEEE